MLQHRQTDRQIGRVPVGFLRENDSRYRTLQYEPPSRTLSAAPPLTLYRPSWHWQEATIQVGHSPKEKIVQKQKQKKKINLDRHLLEALVYTGQRDLAITVERFFNGVHDGKKTRPR
jgi:hypothetical protein